MSQLSVEVTASDPATIELCQAYWEQNADNQFVHKVSVLASRFNVPVNQVTRIVSKNSSAGILNHSCPECGRPTSIRTRSELSSRTRFPPRICESCRTEEARRQREAVESEAAAKRAELANRFPVIDDPEAKVQPSELSLEQAFTLAALFGDGDDSGRGISTPLAGRTLPLAPTPDYETDLIGDLMQSGHLHVHADSPTDAFVWEGTGYSGRYYPRLARFYLSGGGTLPERVQDYLWSFNAVIAQENWPANWHDQLASFWTVLCASDTESYLGHCLRKRSLDLQVGGKTRDTIRRGLQWFSLGQIYYFVWRAAAGASDYYTRSDVSRAQAANSAVTRLGSSIEKAYAEGWDIPTYRRGIHDPESMLWHLLTVRALNLSDPMSFAPAVRRRDATSLRWSEINHETFERLIFTMVDEAQGYEEVRWLMRTHAPDHGRDISATRILKDSLSGYRHFRVVIQCKHWLSKSVTDKDISNELVSVGHWENPPVDVLIMATSGRFTADAVTWTERTNARGQRPYVELWSDAHLESLLSERQHLIVAFKLR